MNHPLSSAPRFPPRAAAAAALLCLAFGLAPAWAQAPQTPPASPQAPASPSQNVMAVPPCQCSQPAPVLGANGPRVVHCVCGALSCAVVVAIGAGTEAQHLQCAK